MKPDETRSRTCLFVVNICEYALVIFFVIFFHMAFMNMCLVQFVYLYIFICLYLSSWFYKMLGGLICWSPPRFGSIIGPLAWNLWAQARGNRLALRCFVRSRGLMICEL